MLAQVLELEEVLVGDAMYDTAAEGQAASMSWVWGTYALLFYRPQSAGRKTLAMGYTFAWRNALASVAGQSASQGVNGVGAQFVRRYFDDHIIADWVEVHKYYDPKVTASDAALLFTNTLA
jgi:hypothetical protein